MSYVDPTTYPLFRRTVANARVYAEYGCGASTRYVLEHTDARVISVESSPHWAKMTTQQVVKNLDRLNLMRVDVGLVDWDGRPLTYEKRDAYIQYVTAIWLQSVNPDVILIDGRWRVACFLSAWVYALPGTPILFDDFYTVGGYHFLAEYMQPITRDKRMALFEVPEKRPNWAELMEIRDQFLMVTD